MASSKRRRERVASVPLHFRNSAFYTFHSDPNRAAELGRKGALANCKVSNRDVRHVSIPASARDVKRNAGQTIADIRAGRMDPKLGARLALGMALLRALKSLSSGSSSND